MRDTSKQRKGFLRGNACGGFMASTVVSASAAPQEQLSAFIEI